MGEVDLKCETQVDREDFRGVLWQDISRHRGEAGIWRKIERGTIIRFDLKRLVNVSAHMLPGRGCISGESHLVSKCGEDAAGLRKSLARCEIFNAASETIGVEEDVPLCEDRWE